MFKKRNWIEYYNLLEKYYQEYGNTDVSISYEVNGIKLGQWIATQRQLYKKNELSIERINKLNELNIKWEIRMAWEEYLELVKAFKNEYGNIDVPTSYEVNGIKLGQWIANQRKSYKGISKTKLSQERIEKLNELGMNWEKRLSWEDYYKLLEEYKETNNNIDVPYYYTINDIKLGIWLHNQRRAHRGKSSYKITPEQITKLNELGMNWETKITWEDYYDLLKDYKEEHDNINVPYKYEINEIKLGSWLANQKTSYKGLCSTKITNEHIRLLNELGIDWSIKDTIFLNSEITDMNEYNIIMLNRMKSLLKDLKLEEVNEIDSKETQEEIEKIIVKRIWR